MSSADAVELYYIEESTWGVTPAAALSQLRFNSESLGHDIQYASSAEIRADRMVTDVVPTQVGAGGDVSGELHFSTIERFYEGAFGNAFGAAVSATGALTIVASTRTVTMTAAFASLEPGDWFKISGAAHASNNSYFKIQTKTSDDEAIVYDPGSELVNETATASCYISLDGRLSNGGALKSYTIEKKFSDLTNVFHAIKGLRVGSLSQEFAVGGMLTWTVGFQGARLYPGSATVGTGAPGAPNGNDVMNAVSNVHAILANNVALTLDITRISYAVNNNLRQRFALGSAQAVGIGMGKFAVDGGFTAYFEDNAQVTDFVNQNAQSFSWRVSDAAGQCYIYDLGSVRFSSLRAVAGGENQDVMQEVGFQARRQASGDYVFRIYRFEP